MNRGKKQSPFIGRRVPLVDDGVPILYPRYRDVSDVLLDGTGGSKKRPAPEQPEPTAAANGHAAPEAAAAPAAVEAAAEQPSKKKSKKEKQQQQQQAPEAPAEPAAPADSNQVTTVTPAVTPADESDEQHALRLRREEKARKKREKQAKRATELAAEAAAAAAAAAGAGDNSAEGGKDTEQQQQQHAADEEDKGNAEEAARIRSVLGFTAGAAGSTAAAAAAPAAAAAVKVPPPSSGFTFNFGGLSGLPTEARVAAETEAKLAAIQAVTAADKDGFVPRRVFVGGMPYSYSREQVAEYWGWCGEIESLDCMTFPDTGRFRGIAFITFASQQAADSALEYDGEQVEGQTLKVERCKAVAAAKHMKAAATLSGHQQRHQQQQHNADGSAEQVQPAAAAAAAGATPAAGPGKAAGYNVAYVGNIAFEAGPDELKALFAECGVTKVRLHTDKATGKSRGYAHVHFADEAGLNRALGLSGSQLHGRGIKVSYGQPKKN